MEKLMVFIKGLLLSAVFIVLSVLVLALVMMKADMGDTALTITTSVIYFIAAFIGGMYCGRKVMNKRFLWGILYGLVYALIYLLIAETVGASAELDISDFIISIGLGIAGGMVGGMLS